MKKQHFLCLILIFLLCCSGCVTLQFEQGGAAVFPDNAYTQPVQQTTPSVQQPDTGNLPVEQTGVPSADNGKTELMWSVAETVSFLNTAVNNTKNAAGSFSMTETLIHNVTDVQLNSESLRNMVQSVTDKFNVSQTKQYLAAGGTATSDNVSIPVQQLLFAETPVFSLSEQEVSAVKVFWDGQNTSIAMLLQNDTADAQFVPSLHRTNIPYLNLHGQDIAPYSVQSASIRYTDVTLAATVNTLGQIVSLTLTAKAMGEAGIGLGIMAAQAHFAAELWENREFVHY